ncbi:MAG: N-acetyltransferase [Candidatus Bathyarchaeota archaeon]|nr:N-acetyltransferase [Candidatus Bathyarchaeum sp.]
MTNVYVDPTAIIDNGVNLGSGTKVWHFVHIMQDAQIGKDCIIADYVYVGRAVKIGNKVKLENRATVYEGVTIKDDVFVGPHVTFTNDRHPRSFNKDWKIQPTLVKEGSSIGARTVIVCGTTIGKYALIGAGSVVTEKIPDYALAYGNPASIRGFVCRCGRKLETIKREEKHVVMECQICNTQIKIPAEDYARIKKEE